MIRNIQEALSLFSETNPSLNWSKKSLIQKIDIIRESGKVLDTFFTLSQMRYYSNSSESLHGSLYGSTLDIGFFEQGFDHTDTQKINDRSYRENTTVLFHLGTLIHEVFTAISHKDDIQELWNHSYKNRNMGFNLLLHSLGVEFKHIQDKP